MFDAFHNPPSQKTNSEHYQIYNKSDNKVKIVEMSLTHSHTMTPFDAPGKQAF